MESKNWLVSPEELKAELGSALEAQQRPILLDVRTLEEYEEAKIEGCVLIPLDELEGRAEAELNKDSKIIVYCGHGVRSLDGMMILKTLGFKNVRSLDGGIVAWQDRS